MYRALTQEDSIGYARPVVLRYALSNIPIDDVVFVFQTALIGGSVCSGVGFGPHGVEPCTLIEIATEDVAKVDSYVAGILKARKESCAYRTIDGGSPLLLRNDGELVRLGPQGHETQGVDTDMAQAMLNTSATTQAVASVQQYGVLKLVR